MRFPQIAARVTQAIEERRRQNTVAVPGREVNVDDYVAPRRDMTREEIIQRLRVLVQTDDLEENLQAVITHMLESSYLAL